MINQAHFDLLHPGAMVPNVLECALSCDYRLRLPARAHCMELTPGGSPEARWKAFHAAMLVLWISSQRLPRAPEVTMMIFGLIRCCCPIWVRAASLQLWLNSRLKRFY